MKKNSKINNLTEKECEQELRNAFENKLLVELPNKKKFVINPLTEQVPATSYRLLKAACQQLAKRIPKTTTVIATEEDRGAILLAGVCYETALSMAIVERCGAQIQAIICVAEKIEYNGKERIMKETEHNVETITGISMAGQKSHVVYYNK